MVSIQTEKIVAQCPNGHRIRGDVVLMGQSVQCPRCSAGFVFAETQPPARKVEKRAVTDTGVMRILGDWSATKNPLDEHAESLANASKMEADVSLSVSGALVHSHDGRVAAKTVRQIMRPRREVACLDLSVSPRDVRKSVQNNPQDWYAVCDPSLDNLLGVVHVGQLTRMLEDEFSFDLASQLLPARRAIDTTPIAQLNVQLQDSASFIIHVVDEFGTVVGFVTDKELRS